MHTYDNLIRFSHELADVAKIEIKKQFRKNNSWNIKPTKNNNRPQIVTKADIESEKSIIISKSDKKKIYSDLIIAADDANIGFPPVRAMGTPPTHPTTA